MILNLIQYKYLRKSLSKYAEHKRPQIVVLWQL